MRYLILFFLLCSSCQVVRYSGSLEDVINLNNKAAPKYANIQDEIMLAVYPVLIRQGFPDSLAVRGAVAASTAVLLESQREGL